MCNAYASHHVRGNPAFASAPIVKALPPTRRTSALMREEEVQVSSSTIAEQGVQIIKSSAQEAATNSSTSRSPCSFPALATLGEGGEGRSCENTCIVGKNPSQLAATSATNSLLLGFCVGCFENDNGLKV